MMKKRLWYFVLVVSLILPCGACGKTAALYNSGGEAEARMPAGSQEGLLEERQEKAGGEEEAICVYVCGAVESPGVYELPAKARIADALDAAGGMTQDAAQTYLNLAEYVTDGQKIEVPTCAEAEALKEAFAEQMSLLVNLNTATAEQLMSLTGIGEAKAEDILDYREKNGGFQSLEELMEIPGIKEGVFEKIKDQITI